MFLTVTSKLKRCKNVKVKFECQIYRYQPEIFGSFKITSNGGFGTIHSYIDLFLGRYFTN